MDKKSLFRNYNSIKPIADKKRLNKALSISMRNKREEKYFTTYSGCTCPDFTYRGGRCKHMLFLMLADSTLHVGDVASPILFPEIVGQITAIEDDTAIVCGTVFMLAELRRA